MSYQVLARKWRPKSFETLVGQEHVVRALSHALATGRLHHAWLFTGTRGVGKTTISRILAKTLNCETGVSATPCGQCDACRAIDADRFPDYVEMDAASNRGVDDMAALLDRAVYAPVAGRYKVYMIDEVHMLTGHAFNAMLKTLEEPPEHVKFILATTDPQKIPVTVLSRCLQFNLKQMPPGPIAEHLARILEAEAVPFEAGALRHLARAANGSMRDALSLLDQAIAHGAGRVVEEQVMQMLGAVGDDHLYAILDALAAGDAEALVAAGDGMEARSLSFEAALQALATLLARVALVQFAPAAVADGHERARLADYAGRFDAEYLQLAYQIAVHGRDELALAPDEYTGFSMSLLRLLAFRPEQPPALGSPGVSGGGANGGARPLPASPAPWGRAAAEAKASFTEAPASGAKNVHAFVAEASPADAPVSRTAAAQPLAPLASARGGDVPPWEAPPPWETTPADAAARDAGGVAAAGRAPDGGETSVRENPGAPLPSEKRMPRENGGQGNSLPHSAGARAPQGREGGPFQSARSGAEVISGNGSPVDAGAAPVFAPEEPAARSAPVAAVEKDGAAVAAAFARGDWRGVVRALGLSGLARELAQHCEWIGFGGERLDLRLSAAHRYLLETNRAAVVRMESDLARALGHPLRLHFEIGAIAGQTPAQCDEIDRQARHAQAVAALESDPFVRGLIERFDASLSEDTVRLL
ncbi:MAG: DNA polymerase III subunit gamma/tau [Azoarcus sp.]|jgi:DNA polymerase-3 subunit gamma/tau|nr:DNA polymerase III subunit gamma/tau [Azoarcus sp.]